jgi:broad specificity phosphatase PhoE
MKFYDLNTILNFGKFEGETIKEVAEIQPSYLDWCAINLDHFYIDEGEIEELKGINPGFSFSEEAKEKLAEKYGNWEDEQEYYADYENPYDYNQPDYYQDYERDTFDALTDGQYGSYDDWRENGGDLDGLMDGLGF